MTVKGSTSNFFTNFKYKVKSNFRIMVILLILHLVAAPLNLINLIIYLSQYEKTTNFTLDSKTLNMLYPVIGVVSTGLAAAAGIIIAMNVFSHLYKKSVVDMTLSLPLTTNQRFFSDFSAGLFTYLIPYVISCVISFIINGIGSSVVIDWSFSGISSITHSLTTLIFAGLFIMVMLYVLTVLVITCCGSIFEALAYSVLVNALIPGTIAVFGYIFMGNLYGIDLSSNIMPLIEKTSPVGALIGLMTSLDANRGLNFELSWFIPFIIITGVYFAGSFFLNKRRKAEQVSKPFVYKAFYYVMITSITFCIGTLFTLNGTSDNVIPLIIITAIIYLIFEVVTNRGFQKFYMSVIRYVITIAVVVGLSLGVEQTNGFGAIEKIPDATNVKSVEMNYGGIFSKFADYGTNYNSMKVYSNEETIKAVINMHEDLIDNYKAYKTKNNNIQKSSYNNHEVYSEYGVDNYVTNISIKYNLKNGGSFTRNYGISFEQYVNLINVDKTEEFKKNLVSTIKQTYESAKKYYDKDYSNSILSLKPPIYVHSWNSGEISNDKSDELIDCLEKDIMQLSDEEYYTPSKDTLAVLSMESRYSNNNEFAINENYSNVLMFLKKYNISLPTADYSDVSDGDYQYQIFKPDKYVIKTDHGDYYYSHMDYYYDKYESNLLNNPDIIELLKHVQKDYVTTEPCYRISFNGNDYIIPPKYSDLAKEVLSKQ